MHLQPVEGATSSYPQDAARDEKPWQPGIWSMVYRGPPRVPVRVLSIAAGSRPCGLPWVPVEYCGRSWGADGNAHVKRVKTVGAVNEMIAVSSFLLVSACPVGTHPPVRIPNGKPSGLRVVPVGFMWASRCSRGRVYAMNPPWSWILRKYPGYLYPRKPQSDDGINIANTCRGSPRHPMGRPRGTPVGPRGDF